MVKTDYPRDIMAAYASREITRQQFIKPFSDWQKSNGIDYDCKGYVDKNGLWLIYRNTRGAVRDGKISFFTDRMRTAKSIPEFERLVDHSKAAERCMTR